MEVFVGIDVACARFKRLPICVVKHDGGRISPVSLPREIIDLIPRGPGNIEIQKERPFESEAHSVLNFLRKIGAVLDCKIVRIAIDAPAAPPNDAPRSCELQMSRAGLSSFQTPTVEQWDTIKHSCNSYLDRSFLYANLPYANKIWMLYGFELFKALRSNNEFDVIEVYPYAIVCSLVEKCPHKSTPEGYLVQLSALAKQTGWDCDGLEMTLKATVRGSRHDRLDAFMAAWIASLPVSHRRAIGSADDANDSIWIPNQPSSASNENRLPFPGGGFDSSP